MLVPLQSASPPGREIYLRADAVLLVEDHPKDAGACRVVYRTADKVESLDVAGASADIATRVNAALTEGKATGAG
jgi:hypothetical protein